MYVQCGRSAAPAVRSPLAALPVRLQGLRTAVFHGL